MTNESNQAVELVASIPAVPTMLRVITEVTGLRVSLVTRVTATEWVCCAANDQMGFGLAPGGTLDVATTLCNEVRTALEPIVISHAAHDPTYCHHPAPRTYNFQSYIAVPIFLRNGDYFGNVCALDAEPRDLSGARTLQLFQLFAQLLGLQLDAEADARATSRALLDATETSELREQFIAVLGHDVRTPLQAIAVGNELLASRDLPAWAQPVVTRIGHSVARITRLIDDVVDFARGRLGGGIPLAASAIPDIVAPLAHVVDELRSVHPGRVVEMRVEGAGGMTGDLTRLTQLLQNLLANALVHSPPEARVGVLVSIRPDKLVLAVTNGGPAVPDEVRARMFEPYRRGNTGNRAGLGLGLYIAAQIVRSHAGTIHVSSVPGTTTVCCAIPRARL